MEGSSKVLRPSVLSVVLEQYEKAVTHPGNQNGNELHKLACVIVRLTAQERLTVNQIMWASKLFILAEERVARAA